MKLFEDEKIILESDSKTLVLTTHRLRHTIEMLGTSMIKSIMLEELDSCSFQKTSQPFIVVLAGAFLLIGLLITIANGTGIPLILGAIVGGILLFIYFATQQQILVFASARTTIRINTAKMTFETVKNFIGAVEKAKNARFLLLSNKA